MWVCPRTCCASLPCEHASIGRRVTGAPHVCAGALVDDLMQDVIMDRMRSSRLARAGSALPPHKEAAEGDLIDMNGTAASK